MLTPHKRPTHRRFEYEPRFYDPRADERLKQRIRLQSKVRRGRRPSFLTLIIILALVLLIYLQV